jgi:hypothetical protein
LLWKGQLVMPHKPIKLSNIKGLMPVVHKLVYELRYHSGYTYLDRCGRILTIIERDYPHWLVDAAQVTPQGAPLVNLRTGAEFRFSSANLSVTWEQTQAEDEMSQEDLDEFFADADMLTQLVVEEIGIDTEKLARIGFRIWYLFPAESQEKAESWLRSLNCWQIPDRLQSAFSANLDSITLGIVLKSEDRCFRLNFGSGERQSQFAAGTRNIAFAPRTLPKGQKDAFARMQEQQEYRKRLRQTSGFVAIIDIDAYQENPLVLDVPDFLVSSWTSGYESIRRATQ